jgi:hypothetical protein
MIFGGKYEEGREKRGKCKRKGKKRAKLNLKKEIK